jgi:anthranilate synthase/phosphoribosyltransferase
MTVLIDNYDSFTYNVYQYLARLSAEPVVVVRNDETDIEKLEAMKPSRLVVSPGPGRPEDAGVSVAAIRHFAGRIPILGVCLGHQAIGYAFGGAIVGAKRIRHGEAEEIALDGRGVYRTVGSKAVFTRYHSLVISEDGLPEDLEVTARSSDGDIMGVRHKKFDIEGVQFHPESIASQSGEALLSAFLNYRREPFAFKRTMDKLVAGQDLSPAEAEAFMEELTEGALETPRVAAILTALAAKGPTAAEIAACVAVLRRKKRPFTAKIPVADTCGTGGDERNSFNISSMAALAAAACGLPIAKHGNRAATSRAGSADFYEALGIPVNITPEQAEKLLEKTGFAFLFAPVYHGAMRHAAPARKAVGIKTIMNLVGPLANPAGAQYQVIGVYDRKLLRPVAEAAHLLGVEKVLTVRSVDGFDEISPCAPTEVVEIGKDGAVREYLFDPEAEGFGLYRSEDLAGGDARENADLARDLAGGAGRAALEAATAFNAGAALYAAGRAASIADGARMAAAALASGAVAAKIEELRGALNG